MTLPRRAVLSGGLALLTRPLWAADTVPTAASLARAPDPVGRPQLLNILDENKQPVPLDQFHGTPVLLNFWAPWCLPCREEMPSLARLAAATVGALHVLPVSFDWRGAAGVKRFYRETQIDNLPVLTGAGKDLVAAFGMEHLPASVLLDRAGRHVATVQGEAVWDDPDTLAWLTGLTG